MLLSHRDSFCLATIAMFFIGVSVKNMEDRL